MSSKNGFSTVELMVSVALFSAVVAMTIAALMVMIDANQKARSVKIAMDNLNLVIDDMSRSLRLGSKYYCQQDANPAIPNGLSTNDCPFVNNITSGGVFIRFRDHNRKVVFYRFDGTCIQKKVTDANWLDGYTDNLSGYACITGSDVTFNRVRFYVSNTALNSGAQPYVQIVVSGTVGAKQSTQTSFSIMTSVSQRIPHNVE